jgi:CheY-like chemotaxis protein
MKEPSAGRRAGHVLIVDDDHEIRETIADVLTDAGYEVDQAENGRAALDLLRARDAQPDLILLDLMMPVMSGGEFVLEVAKHAQLRTVPIVVISAHLGSFPQPGAYECLLKPFSTQRLREVVAHYCMRPRAASKR